MFSKRKGPRNTSEYFWTNHVKFKMQYYALSSQKILSVIKKPARKEEGIVARTIAVMKPVNPKLIGKKETWKQEIWVMYQLRSREVISKSQYPISKKIQNSKLKIQNSSRRQMRIISAWRYPGVSPQKNPVPEEILSEIAEIV